ncbi:MAG: hypothetical protein NC218_00515 [Acetobacter sp.]|nr:hypothetical protein [Acetobacter sp.]
MNYKTFAMVEKRYAQIYQLCVYKFIQNPLDENAKDFPKIINLCEKLCDEYEKKCWLDRVCKFSDDVTDDKFDDVKGGIAKEILAAYHPRVSKTSLKHDDLYFLFSKPAKLLEWDAERSPYEKLHHINALVHKEKEQREADISDLLRQIIELLNSNISHEILMEKLKRLCMIYKVDSSLLFNVF